MAVKEVELTQTRETCGNYFVRMQESMAQAADYQQSAEKCKKLAARSEKERIRLEAEKKEILGTLEAVRKEKDSK